MRCQREAMALQRSDDGDAHLERWFSSESLAQTQGDPFAHGKIRRPKGIVCAPVKMLQRTRASGTYGWMR